MATIVSNTSHYGPAQPLQPGYPVPNYPPPPYYPPVVQQQQQSVVVVTSPAAPIHSTVVVKRQGVNHLLHCLISVIFFPWVIVWLILCIADTTT